MHFIGYGRTDVGRHRDNNEDNLAVLIPGEREPCLFAVADGVGGNKFGEVASEMAMMSLARQFHEHKPRFAEYTLERDHELRGALATLVGEMIEAASAEIFARGRADRTYQGMSTTVVALIATGHAAFLGHVGDSRAYLIRRGEIYRLTEDHTWAAEMVCTRLISYAEAQDHPYAGVLSRSVGSQPHVKVDTTYLEIEPDDRFIICSDGLHRYFGGRELMERSSSENDPRALVDRLIEEANAQGGEDNVTVVVVEAIGGVETMRSMALQEEISLLQNTFLFEQLSTNEVMRLMKIMYRERHAAGDVIIREGDEGETIYIVAQGEADVSLRGAHLATIEPGGHFGELALVDDRVRAATVTAKTDLTLLRIHKNDFIAIMREDSQLATKLLWSFIHGMADTLRSLSQEIVSFSRMLGDDSDATIIDLGAGRQGC